MEGIRIKAHAWELTELGSEWVVRGGRKVICVSFRYEVAATRDRPWLVSKEIANQVQRRSGRGMLESAGRWVSAEQLMSWVRGKDATLSRHVIGQQFCESLGMSVE